MSIADRLQKAKPYDPGLPCSVATTLDKLQGEDKEALEAVLSTKSDKTGISNRQIHQILVDEGHTVAFYSVAAHRRKQCRCFLSEARRPQRQKAQ